MSRNSSKEHRPEDLCGAQAFKPVFPRICFSRAPTRVYSRIPDNETEASGGCELKKNVNISAKRVTLTLPEIGLIAMTRGALGVGIGLVVSNALEKEERRSAGLALLAVGMLTTVPILMRLRNELK